MMNLRTRCTPAFCKDGRGGVSASSDALRLSLPAALPRPPPSNMPHAPEHALPPSPAPTPDPAARRPPLPSGTPLVLQPEQAGRTPLLQLFMLSSTPGVGFSRGHHQGALSSRLWHGDRKRQQRFPPRSCLGTAWRRESPLSFQGLSLPLPTLVPPALPQLKLPLAILPGRLLLRLLFQ